MIWSTGPEMLKWLKDPTSSTLQSTMCPVFGFRKLDPEDKGKKYPDSEADSNFIPYKFISEPGVQHHFLPASFVNHGRAMANTFKGPNVKSIHGYADHIYTLRQYSRGNLKIKSANPHEHPAIDPKSLSHPEDLPQMVKARFIIDFLHDMLALESQIL